MNRFVLGVMAAVAFGALAPAQAADLPVKAPLAPIVPPYSWTGLYVGINGGYSWGRSDTDVQFLTFPGGVPIVAPAGSITSADFKMDGGIAGVQAGYNWQQNNWVLGIEGDIQWSGQKGSADFLCAAPPFGGATCLPGFTFLPAGSTGVTLAIEQSLRWFGTLRGRAGVTVTPTWLLYVTGGLAVGNIKTDATLAGFTNAAPSVLVAATSSSSVTRAGWTAGLGTEFAIGGRWTAKIEYLYIDFGDVSGNVANPLIGIQANYSSSVTDNILRAGINYRF
jgi:outer membrane immunogenic protein